MNGRSFRDLDDLKAQLQRRLLEVNILRIHQTTKHRPIHLFVEEHSNLQQLPKYQYDTAHLTHIAVHQESSVQWKGNLGVVPQDYMYEICPVPIPEAELIDYSLDGEPITTTPLANKGKRAYKLETSRTKARVQVPTSRMLLSTWRLLLRI